MNIASIRDVAQKAGVSIATVSHVLNRSRFVSSELIERVEAALEELKYQPRQRGKTNGTQKSKIICLIVPDSSQPLMAPLCRDIEDILFFNKYEVVVSNTLYDINREIQILRAVRSKMIDGILIMPSTNSIVDIDDFVSVRTPIVTIDREVQNGKVDCVLTDNQKAGFIATEHLIKLGHVHIAFIDRMIDQSHSVDRKDGFLRALSKHKIPLDPNMIIRTRGISFKDGEEVAKALLDQKPRPTAIVALNDDLAIGAVNMAYRMGFNVPTDISVIGYGNTTYGEEYLPALTTIHYPATDIARTACSLILARIDGTADNSEKQRKIISEHKLIVRSSTGRVRNNQATQKG